MSMQDHNLALRLARQTKKRIKQRPKNWKMKIYDWENSRPPANISLPKNCNIC